MKDFFFKFICVCTLIVCAGWFLYYLKKPHTETTAVPALKTDVATWTDSAALIRELQQQVTTLQREGKQYYNDAMNYRSIVKSTVDRNNYQDLTTLKIDSIK